MAYYAVKVGRKPGIYNTWEQCYTQINKYSNSIYKKFATIEEVCFNCCMIGLKAQAYINNDSVLTNNIVSYYAVAKGDTPGIYTTWDDCKKAIGQKNWERDKKFTSMQEAQDFIEEKKILNKSVVPACSSSVISTLAIVQDAPSTGNSLKRKAPEVQNGDNNKRQNTGSSNVVVIYTDGSALNNGKPIARAGVGVYFGHNDPRNISERLPGPLQTNQRAEIFAVIRALQTTDSHVDVQIRTDSKYTINAMTDCIKSWKRNNWSKEVKNRDIFMQLDDLIETRTGRTDFKYVKGHSGHSGNDAADKLAREGALK